MSWNGAPVRKWKTISRSLPSITQPTQLGCVFCTAGGDKIPFTVSYGGLACANTKLIMMAKMMRSPSVIFSVFTTTLVQTEKAQQLSQGPELLSDLSQ